MKRNVEIKVAVTDLATLLQRVEALVSEGPVVLDQEDTFFHARRLMTQLGMAESPPVANAYIDLLERESESSGESG